MTDFHREQSVGLLTRQNRSENPITEMEARAEHLKTKNYRSLYGVTSFLGLGIFVMMLTWLVRFRGGFSWSSDPKKEFNWHPFLMTTALLLLYGQSALIYRSFRGSLKKNLKIGHAILNFTSFVLAVIGLKAVFDSHNLAPKPIPNLYTMHSWIGITTVILFTGQFLIGFTSFLYPGLSKTLRQSILPVHAATGVAIFILAVVTALTGLTEKTIWALGDSYSSLPSEGVLVNFIALFIVFFGILVLYLINDPDYKRNNLPEEEVALAQSEH